MDWWKLAILAFFVMLVLWTVYSCLCVSGKCAQDEERRE